MKQHGHKTPAAAGQAMAHAEEAVDPAGSGATPAGGPPQVVLTWSHSRRCIVAEAPELAAEPLACGPTYAAALAAAEAVLEQRAHAGILARQQPTGGASRPDVPEPTVSVPVPVLASRRLLPLSDERARCVAAAAAAGEAHARRDLGVHTPSGGHLPYRMDRWGLEAVAWQQAADTLAAEPVATSASAALATALAAAYTAGYRDAARAEGFGQLEHDDDC
jgi:hypothetical protein